MKTLLLAPVFRVLAAIGIFTVGLTGCRTDAQAVCDEKCDCEGCSNQALDNCYNDELSKEREADNKGCLDYYDDLKACEWNTWICKSGNDFETSCKTEKERYDNCKK